MRLSLWPSEAAGEHPYLLRICLLISSLARLSDAINFTPEPLANLDLSNLGRVALAGDFNGISLFEFEGQNQNGFSTNGSQSILTRFPNGGFASLAAADAGIQAMCSFVMSNGAMAGVVVGGNFTSLGGVQSAGAAMFNPNTSAVIPLTGLSGQVSALLCDEATNTVYVGGSFKAANSTNAIAWVGTAGWTNLPFEGFNGPVTSISKASNGHIIFGGEFTGLGNVGGSSFITPDQQIVNIAGGNISAIGSTTTTGFSDPRNIVCKTSGADGVGNTWLLADNSVGSWKASFGFGFEPTKLRLWNTHQDGRGTKTWRYTAAPIDGIMNFTFTDPATGLNSSCTSECPLSNNASVKYQDFHFVNVIGMSGFQIDISAFYGSGGGLDGIELFQDDIFAYSINTFNEPSCASISTASSATVTGPWQVTPSRDSTSQYLSASISGSSTDSIVFFPDIKQSGNYSVNMYTPGCIQDNTCTSRGRISISGNMASKDNTGFNSTLFQTNNFDKYDQIYFGYIEASSASFRPSVTLSAATDQSLTNLTLVAQRVGFTLISSAAGGLNNIFEYDPTQAVVNTADFANSTFDVAGTSLPLGSGVNALATSGSTTFVGGNFTTTNFNNIFSISSSGSSALTGTGLNGEVVTMFLNGTNLYVGGMFTNTTTGGSAGLYNVAVYDTSKKTWSPLGNGVNGLVSHIVPLLMNVTANTPETVITLTGDFRQILAFGQNSSIAVTGFAVWVPSRGNWLQNLNTATMGISGALTASVDIPSGGSLFAGTLSTSQLAANGAVGLASGLISLPINIQPTAAQSTVGLTKRATSSSQNVSGVVTGLFYENGGRNVTVLGGHFTATATGGSIINNLAFINGSNSDTVTGVGSSLSNDSTILALALSGDVLYAGGSLTGTVNGATVSGLMSFNLFNSTFGIQPPSLTGGNVNAIALRPGTAELYVGGGFSLAGALTCPTVCLFSTIASQWSRPGTTLGGTVNAMVWASPNSLIVAGSLVVNGGNTSVATYDPTTQIWALFPGATAIPGPATTLTTATSDAKQFWVGGTAQNGSTFLMKYDGTTWNSVGNVFGSGTTIRGLQVMSLTKNHAGTSLVSANEVLMVTGALNLPGFGGASSALYNGTTFQPFALTTNSANTGGSLSQIFSREQNFFSAPSGGLAIGLVVLIALAIALGLIFLIVIAGVIFERIQRRREGYMPASTYDRSNGMSRVPPEQLFSSIGQSRSGVEQQNTRI